jgi:hypothetical protein
MLASCGFGVDLAWASVGLARVRCGLRSGLARALDEFDVGFAQVWRGPCWRRGRAAGDEEAGCCRRGRFVACVPVARLVFRREVVLPGQFVLGRFHFGPAAARRPLGDHSPSRRGPLHIAGPVAPQRRSCRGVGRTAGLVASRLVASQGGLRQGGPQCRVRRRRVVPQCRVHRRAAGVAASVVPWRWPCRRGGQDCGAGRARPQSRRGGGHIAGSQGWERRGAGRVGPAPLVLARCRVIPPWRRTAFPLRRRAATGPALPPPFPAGPRRSWRTRCREPSRRRR